MALLAVACVPKPSEWGEQNGSSSSQGIVLDEKQTAAAVLEALMEQDMTALATYMHPKKGVRFTAETHVRPTADEYGTPKDNVIYADQIEALKGSKKLETWGIQDGSGQPIELSFDQYMAKYVADHDYRKATDVRWDHVQDHGSTIDNAKTVYPNARIVEYHFPGFDPQYGGMDWASLRLVLEEDATSKKWHLVGVIHDHWTP